MSFNTKINGPVEIIAEIEIQNNPDLAGIDMTRVRGGYFSVADVTTRDLIPVDLRKANVTKAWVESQEIEYVLRGGIDNANWEPSGAGQSDDTYTNPNPTPAPVGQIPAGSTFANVPHDDMWTNLLYSLTASISATNPVRAKGSPTQTTLNWSVIKKANAITAITVAGESIVPTGNSQNGSKVVNTAPNTNTTYQFVVSDGASTLTRNASITYLNYRFWGSLNKSGLSGQLITQTDIQDSLSHELASNRLQTRNGINGNGNYLVFAWPSTFNTPVFSVNGLPNSAFTKVRADWAFTNEFGFTENYDVWVSNTRYNSPADKFEVI